MDETLKKKILRILDEHRIMTVATNRSDGWPQATTVGYVSDGLTLYFLCSPQSQKAENLAREPHFFDHRPRYLGPHGDQGPLDGSPGASSDRSDRGSESLVYASSKISRLCRVPDAETGGDCCIPSGAKGDLGPRLHEGIWTRRARDSLIHEDTREHQPVGELREGLRRGRSSLRLLSVTVTDLCPT